MCVCPEMTEEKHWLEVRERRKETCFTRITVLRSTSIVSLVSKTKSTDHLTRVESISGLANQFARATNEKILFVR